MKNLAASLQGNHTAKVKKMNESARKELHKGLKAHYGSMKEIGLRTGFSRIHVLDVLKGKYENLEILEAAVQHLHELEANKRARTERLENMMKALQTATA
jgi:pyruvate-formate lyase